MLLNQINNYKELYVFDDFLGLEPLCYEKINEYEKAIELYDKLKLYNECGRIYYDIIENYIQVKLS